MISAGWNQQNLSSFFKEMVMRGYYMRSFWAFCGMLLYTAVPAFADEFRPVFNPTLEIKRVNSTVTVDGNLDDSGWINASRVSNFVERFPGKNIEPLVRTEAFVTYDDNLLYVAFKCYDDPSKVRATMTQRDQFEGDDNVVLLIDTYGNAAWAYEFFVNPYGIQRDNLWSSINGEDAGFDLTWHSAASITDSGYQVEMAIPFSSMRFPNREAQVWKMDFWRNHPRDSQRQYSWAAYNQEDQCWVCQWGTASGIMNVKPGKGLEILPSLVGSQSGQLSDPSDPNSRFENQDADAQLSLGGKYPLSSDVTLEASYNPDFSQIEADAAQIDVNSTISLLYPERRPFFQEGSDIFRTLFNSFYTRTVNDPQFAAKLTGRVNRYSIGFMSAYDENTPYIIPLQERSVLINSGHSAVHALRGTRSFSGNNQVGFIITDRRFEDDGYGTVVGVDGDIRLSAKYSVIGQLIMSYTREPTDSVLSEGLEGITFNKGRHTAALDGEAYSGDAVIAQLRRRSRGWNFTINYDHVGPAYRTETGYDPWNDYRNFFMYNEYNTFPTGTIFERITPSLNFDTRYDFDAGRKWIHYGLGVNNTFRFAQAYLGGNYFRSEEKWGGIEFVDMWNTEIFGGARLTHALGLEFNAHYGPNVARWLLEKGNETFAYAGLEFKPIDRIVFEPTLNYYKITHVDTGDELLKQTIARMRTRYQVNREFSVRLVTQYNDYDDNWEIDPLLTYRLSPFSLFYLGSTHDVTQMTNPMDNQKVWEQTSRQFFMKLQYLFRI
jgi:hypothetical protein